MKKFLLLAIVMIASANVFAQREVGSVTLQPRIGVIGADFNNTGDTEARVGLIAGADFEYYATPIIGLSAGAFYAQQGAELKDYNVKMKLDYVNVPLIVNFYVWKGLALKTGLQAGFKVSSDLEVTSDYGKGSINIKDEVNTFDLAVPLGISYDFGRLVLDARYTLGLTKVFKDDDYDTKNLTFQLAIGYKFSL